MTPVLCCGFECGILTSGSGAVTDVHFTSTSGAPSISTTTIRSGARSLSCNAAGAAVIAGCAFSGTNQLRLIVRVYIYFATLPSADVTLAQFSNAASADGPGLRFQLSDSSLYAAVATTLGSTGIPVTTGQWYRVDADWTISAAGNDTADIRINGMACGQASAAGRASGIGTMGLGVIGAVTADVFFDDLVLSQTAADYPIGPGFVNHFVPTSDGTHNIAGAGDFQRGNTGVDILNATTTAWQLVDDIPLPSGTVDQADCQRGVAPANPTTDYVHGVFGPASGVPTPTRGPRAVDVILAHHQISTTSGQMEVRLDDNGTVSTIFNTGAAAGVTTYRYARAQFATPPTGGSWAATGTSGNFNLVGYRFLAQDANPDQCLDAIMIEAEFIDDGLNGIWRPSVPDLLPVMNSVIASGMTPGRPT